MHVFNAISLTQAVNDWLANSRHARLLHVFDHTCNLINEKQEVLSMVPASIGNGPFNLVLKDKLLFSETLHVETPVSLLEDGLEVGDLAFFVTGAECWSPRPGWERLYEERGNIASGLAAIPIPASQSPRQLTDLLSSALVSGDVPSSMEIASRLAGLGIGLTPAGDDFLMGALYAIWMIYPAAQAEFLARKVSDITAPLTTSLSAAWLRAAGRGEAGILWHELFDGLACSDPVRVNGWMEKIMSIGATSGAEALAGFISTFHSYWERKETYVLPGCIR